MAWRLVRWRMWSGQHSRVGEMRSVVHYLTDDYGSHLRTEDVFGEVESMCCEMRYQQTLEGDSANGVQMYESSQLIVYGRRVRPMTMDRKHAIGRRRLKEL